jgi:hypothetical protein
MYTLLDLEMMTSWQVLMSRNGHDFDPEQGQNIFTDLQ